MMSNVACLHAFQLIIHTFGESFINSVNHSYIRRIIHTFGELFIQSANYSYTRLIIYNYHIIGELFIHSALKIHSPHRRDETRRGEACRKRPN